jgi:glycosyltransferase involved in cell wall biosynthesis
MLTTLSLTLTRLTGLKQRILHGHNDLRPRLVHRSLVYRAYVSASLGLSRVLSTRRLACSQQSAEWIFGEHAETPAERRAELLIGTDLDACLQAEDPGLRARLGIPEDRFVLAQIGRFTVAKNHAFTVEIARLLAESHVNFHLLFMGDGPLQTKIQQELERLGLADNVTWIPNCKEVPAILRSVVDAVLLPSLHEGLGLAVVEAQAAGVPVLISDMVTRECVILPQLADFLPIDRGPAPWVERVLALIKEPRSRTPSPEHRQAVVSSRFHIDHSVARLSALYLELAQCVPGGTV